MNYQEIYSCNVNMLYIDIPFLVVIGHGSKKSKCPFDDGNYVQTRKTWYEAREDCIRNGTDLYVNEDMNTNVCGTQTKNKNTWIGLRNVRWTGLDKHTKGCTYFQILFYYLRTAQNCTKVVHQ